MIILQTLILKIEGIPDEKGKKADKTVSAQSTQGNVKQHNR